MQQQIDAFAFCFSQTMLEFLLEGAFFKEVKTSAYNWADQRKQQDRANLELKLYESPQAFRDDMMRVHLITNDQVLKADLEEMTAVRERQSNMREAPKEVITTELVI